MSNVVSCDSLTSFTLKCMHYDGVHIVLLPDKPYNVVQTLFSRPIEGNHFRLHPPGEKWISCPTDQRRGALLQLDLYEPARRKLSLCVEVYENFSPHKMLFPGISLQGLVDQRKKILEKLRESVVVFTGELETWEVFISNVIRQFVDRVILL